MKKNILILFFLFFLVLTGCQEKTPVFEINDDYLEIFIGQEYEINKKIENPEFEVIWTSNDENVATVTDSGVIKGIKEGVASIFVNYGEIEKEVVVVVNAKEITLNYDGGSSEELYSSTSSIAHFTLTNYNTNSGAYWGDGQGYSKYVYITDKDNDPKATFSDRIYIGKNKYTGYYEIIDIITSGASSWPEGAEYVISISHSYSSYSAIHNTVLKLKTGLIVIIDNEISKIDGANTSRVSFFDSKIDINEVVLSESSLQDLPTPIKLGYEFLGWYDENGRKYNSLSEITSSIKLEAKWNERILVTDIVTENVPQELLTGDIFDLNSSVYPTDSYFQEIFYSSSNEDIIKVSDEGKLTAINSGKAVIVLKDYMERVKKTYEVVVYSVPSVDVEFESETGEYNGYLEIGQEVKLNATYFGKGEVTSIKFVSSSSSVATISEEGLVKANNEGVTVITIDAETTNGNYKLLVNVLVENVSAENKIDEVIKLIMENNFGVVEVGNACLYDDGTDRYYKATYGSVNKILFDKFIINDKYASTAENNKNGHKSRRSVDTIEFVTVHDTATLTGSANGTAKGMATGSTSIHYVVGNDEIYGVVPEKYIAYHAGDGTYNNFQWNASGVKAETNSAPKFGIVKDGTKYYFTINGEKSNLVAPTSNGTKSISNPTNDSLTELGPVWKIENGEYYLGTTWVCFSQVAAGKICSHGGNDNSIGIEMCVNMSSDMYDTWQRTAMLVADICIRNNLDLTRVKQHNTWSGKNCPQDILAGSYWEEFMKMVEVQYALQSLYSDVVISMKSNNPDIVDNTGRVINAPTITTTVSYEVTVSCGDESKTITLYSVVPGSTTWEQWNGTYSAKKIWNNGKFVK